MRDENWNKAWKSQVDGLSGLYFIPNEQDSNRIVEIQLELRDIINRNTIKGD